MVQTIFKRSLHGMYDIGMYDIFELFHKAQIISIEELVKGHK